MQPLTLYQTSLQLPEERIAPLWELLSADEQVRANRFYFPEHRRRFIVARGILRKLLAEKLQITPEEIQFTYSEYGKPELAKQNPANPLYFNVAHSHELAAYVFSDTPEIGIDIEYIREDIKPEEIVERYFSAAEIAEFFQFPPAEWNRIFFNGWTRKEAFIKAIGEGLSFPLKDFVVSLSDAEACLRSIRNDFEAAKAWSMFSWIPQEGYVGALAIRAQIKTFVVATAC